MADDLLVRVGITEKQYLAAITRMEKQSVRAAKQAEAAFAKSNTRLVRGAQSANKATSALGGQGLRMVSMQLSQVASQGAATGNYLQALAIQAPDLALGFGAFGIAAGALVPILYSLAQGSALFSSEAVDLEDTLEDLSQTMTRLSQAQAQAGRGRGDLRAEYGDLADEAARLFAIEKQIAAARAAQAIQGAAVGVAGGLGVRGALGLDPNDIRQTELAVSALTDEVIRLRERAAAATDTALAIGFEVMAEEAADMAVQLRAVDGAMGELATSLGVTEEAAREIAAQFAEIAALDAGREQAEAFEALASYIFEASDGLVEATEEGDALYNALWQAVQASLDLAAVDMAGGIGAAASEAERLAAALSRAIAMNPITPDMRDEDAVMSQSVLPDASTRETQRRALENFRRLTAPPKRSGGGGGGGVSKEAAEAKAMAQAAQRYVEETRTGVEQLVAELAELEELNRRGFFAEHPEAYARAVAAVHDELTAIEFEAVLEGIDSVADAMAAAIVQGEDMGEALRDVFRQIAQDLISSGIRQGLMSLIPSSGGTSRGGLLGGLLGGIFGGFRAAGGPVSPGQSYVVGERGPELFTPRSVGSILPNGGGSGGQVEVLVGIDQATGSLVPVIERVSGAVSAQVVSAYGRETRRAQPGQMRQSQARGGAGMTRPVVTVPDCLLAQVEIAWEIDWRSASGGEFLDGVTRTHFQGFPRWLGRPRVALDAPRLRAWRAIRATARGRWGIYRLPMADPLTFVRTATSARADVLDGMPHADGRRFSSGAGYLVQPYCVAHWGASQGATTLQLDTAPCGGVLPVVGQIMSAGDLPFMVTWVGPAVGTVVEVGVEMPLRAAVGLGDVVLMRGHGLFEAADDGMGAPVYGAARHARLALSFVEVTW